MLIAIQDRLCLSPIKYIFKNLLCHFDSPYHFVVYGAGQLLPKASIVISYGFDLPCVKHAPHMHIAASVLFTEDYYLKTVSLPKEPVWYEKSPFVWKSEHYPQETLSEGLKPNALVVPDILASAFFLLTCYEEFVQGGPLDRRQRFTAASSWNGRHNLLDRPLVDEYRLLFQEWVLQLLPQTPMTQPNWNGHSFAFALTRDIDSLQKNCPPSVKQFISSLIRGQPAEGFKRLIDSSKVHLLGRTDPHSNLEEIITWEKQLHIRSSIYLMASNESGDSNYDLRDFRYDGLLQNAFNEGWEIGFHPGFRTYLDKHYFQEEYTRLKEKFAPIVGGRQHTLRFRAPYTWRLWEQVGLHYDSTLGYADREGFRCGTSFPFKPYDLLENREMDLWEVPLVLMDNTLDKYRGLTLEQAQNSIHDLLERVEHHHGVFVMLWHNSYFGNDNVGAFHDMLAEFVQVALSKNTVAIPLREVVNIWKDFTTRNTQFEGRDV